MEQLDGVNNHSDEVGMGQKSVVVSSQGTSQGWKKILHGVEIPLVMGGQECSLLKQIQ